VYVLLPLTGNTQVINIETKRFLNDTNGFVGRSDLNFNINQNVQQVMSFGINVHAQYQYNKHRLLGISDLALIKGANQDFLNNGYQHIRYSYKINKRITWENFIQGQYNLVLKLDKRYLAGSGPRFRIIKQKHFRLYAASLYMYEFQSQDQEKIIQYNHRNSSYLTFNIDYTKINFTTTVFYQPLLNNFSNYRIATDSNLGITLNAHFNFRIGFNLLYDTHQPPGIPALVYGMRNGISFRF
jgi:hypothetical protein